MSDSWIFVRQLSDKEPDITILITGLFHCNKPVSQNVVARGSDSVTACSDTNPTDLGCIPGFAILDGYSSCVTSASCVITVVHTCL